MANRVSSNYSSWDIKVDDFFHITNDGERLLFLLGFAVLAPSGHNSQPWLFQVIDHKIRVLINSERVLSVGDPEKKLLYIGLGCALANLLIAAEYYGWLPKMEIILQGDRVVDLSFPEYDSKGVQVHNIDDLIFYINQRATNRNPYNQAALPPELVQEIKSLEQPGQVKIDLIRDSDIKTTLAQTINRAAIEIMNSRDFREELCKYVKTNVTKSKIGMPAFGMGIPTLPSLFAPLLVRYFNFDKLNAHKNELLLAKHTPVFIVISTPSDTYSDHIISGEIYERIALWCAKYGVSTSIWGAAVLNKKCYNYIQTILGSTYCPQLLCRAGYATKAVRHSPRLLIKDVLI